MRKWSLKSLPSWGRASWDRGGWGLTGRGVTASPALGPGPARCGDQSSWEMRGQLALRPARLLPPASGSPPSKGSVGHADAQEWAPAQGDGQSPDGGGGRPRARPKWSLEVSQEPSPAPATSTKLSWNSREKMLLPEERSVPAPGGLPRGHLCRPGSPDAIPVPSLWERGTCV